MITKFEDIVQVLKEQKTVITVVVPMAQDEICVHAVDYTFKQLGKDVVDVILIGDKTEIEKIIDRDNFPQFLKDKIIDIKVQQQAVFTAAQFIREGKANVLLKGKITSDQLMQLILDKEKGLRKPGKIISHIRVFETPWGMLLISDGGIIINPDPEIKKKILDNAVEVAVGLGMKPEVAELSGEYTLTQAFQNNANVLIMPWITPGNIVYKALIHEPPWEVNYERSINDAQCGNIYIFKKYIKNKFCGYLLIAAVAGNTASYDKKKTALERTIQEAKNLGLGKQDKIKIGLLDFTEQHLAGVPSIQDSLKLVEEYTAHPEVIVEGPMAYDIVISAESARIKNFMGNKCQVPGVPDILFCPDSDCAQFLYEVYLNFNRWKLPWEAGDISYGASGIVLVPSRSDSETHKFHSIITAVYLKRMKDDKVK